MAKIIRVLGCLLFAAFVFGNAHLCFGQTCQDLPALGAPQKITSKIRGEFLNSGKRLVQDVYLRSEDGSQTRAFIIRPYKPEPNPAAVMFVHLLGPPPDNDREEFF